MALLPRSGVPASPHTSCVRGNTISMLIISYPIYVSTRKGAGGRLSKNLFRGFTVKMLFVLLRFLLRYMYYAIAMMRWHIKSVEFHFPFTDIYNMVFRPSSNNDGRAVGNLVRNGGPNRFGLPRFASYNP